MRRRLPLLRSLRRAGTIVALAFAAACFMIGVPTLASAEHKPSSGLRCTHLFAPDGGYIFHGRAYNVTCQQAQKYSGTLPDGWSGALRNDGTAENALLYRSRDAERVMRAIRPGGKTADPRILGHRPLVIVYVG